MQAIKITSETMPSILEKLELAKNAEKDYQIEIKQHDSSLKARQRALARCWYAEIAEQQGVSIGYSEALCKYRHGLKIRCEDDPDLEKIVRRMLDGYSYEQKLKIIEIYPEWFPLLRNKNGMTSEQQGRYLAEIQQAMAANGIFLTSPNEKGLLSYPEAEI